MCTKPFNLDSPIFKDHPDYQAELIAHDIENNPVIANQTGISVYLFELIEISEFR